MPRVEATQVKTAVIAGPFWTRRKARRVEREVQGTLDAWGDGFAKRASDAEVRVAGERVVVERWVRGVRVERMGARHFSKAAGRVTWCLVATSEAGH